MTSDTYPPYRPAAKAIFFEGMAKRGHQVDWVMQSSAFCEQTQIIEYTTGSFYIARNKKGSSRWRRFVKYWDDFANDLHVFKLLKNNKYDIVQVKDKYFSAALVLFFSKFSTARYNYWLAYPHSEADLYAAKENIARYRFFYYLRGRFYKLILYKLLLPGSEHIFVQSDQMKKDIEKFGIPSKKMTPIPGSVNLKNIPYIKPTLCHSSVGFYSSKEIVYLGTLIRERQLDFLIRVLNEVVKDVPAAKLILIGSGENPEDEALLYNEIKRCKLENSVVFTGYLPMSEAWEYIRRAEVCVSPYYPIPILQSTSPTKLIEYMAMGKAVVGNDHPEQSQVIAESGGGLCTPWNEIKFAEAIIQLLNNPSMAAEMGMKGRLYVENFRTNEVMTDIVEKEYKRLINENLAN